MSGEILLGLILGAWILHDYMTWGPLSPQSWSWAKGTLNEVLYGTKEYHDSVYAPSTWSVDEREGVINIADRVPVRQSPWDMAS